MHTLERLHFGKNDIEQTCLVKQFQAASRMPLSENQEQLVTNPLGGNPKQAFRVLSDCSADRRLDCDGPFNCGLRIADCALREPQGALSLSTGGLTEGSDRSMSARSA